MKGWARVGSAFVCGVGLVSFVVARQIESKRDTAMDPTINTAEDSTRISTGEEVSNPRLEVKAIGESPFVLHELMLPPAFERTLDAFARQKGGEARQLSSDAFEVPQQVRIRQASDGTLANLHNEGDGDWQNVTVTSEAAVIDLNGDGRDDVVTVVWIPQKKLIALVALITDGPAIDAKELTTYTIAADSTSRVEIRELNWTAGLAHFSPRVSDRISLGTTGPTPTVRWIPARCDGSGREWRWKFGRFWEHQTECTPQEAASPPDQQQRLNGASTMLDNVQRLQIGDSQVIPILAKAEYTLAGAQALNRNLVTSEAASRSVAKKLLITQALKTAAYLKRGRLDSALAAAGRWRQSAANLGDSSEEHEAIAWIAAVYAQLDRSEVFEQYIGQLGPARLSPESSDYLTMSTGLLSKTVTVRGEKELAHRIDAIAAAVNSRTDARRASTTESGFAGIPAAIQARMKEAGQRMDRAMASGSPDSLANAYLAYEALAQHGPLMRSRELAAVGALYSEMALALVNHRPDATTANRYMNAGIKYLGDALQLAENPLGMVMELGTPLHGPGIGRLGDRIGYAESWIPIQSLLALDYLLVGNPGAALVVGQRLSDLAADPYNSVMMDPHRAASVFAPPLKGSVLIFLPMIQGFAVVTTRHLGSGLQFRGIIPDTTGRLLLLAAAAKVLIEREAGIVSTNSRDKNAENWPVIRLADSLSSRGGAAEALRELADALFPTSVREGLDPDGELVIYAPGVLGLVPFAALPVRNTTGARRLLVESYSVRMTTGPVDAFDDRWRENVFQDFRLGNGQRQALVLGNPRQAPRSFFEGLFARRSDIPPPLPSAASEANEVGQLLGVKAALGKNATKTRVLESWNSRGVIHIAAHTHIDTRRGHSDSSYIQLADDSLNDGRIYRSDLANARGTSVNGPDLVVLSGCESGIGEVKWVSGMMGFQRAVVQAGARSVITTLWPILDEPGKLLTVSFYAHWLRDSDRPNKPEALRRAQNEIRRLPGYESAYYWAGFQLAGAP